MKKQSILFLLCSFLFISCKEEKYANETVQLFQNKQITIPKKANKIIVISEQGCHSCNKHFYEYFQSNKSNKNCYYIINASGAVLDISELKKGMNENFTLINSKEPFFNETKIIVANNRQIDTIIKINAREITEQISCLDKI